MKEALKYYLIAHISAVEVFFKDIISQYSGKWTSFSSLLTDKVTLQEAYEVFKERGVQRESLVLYMYSFQRLESISTVFDKLIGKDFLYSVGEYTIMINDEIGDEDYAFELNNDYSNWRRELIEAFDLRNKIIHDNTRNLKIGEAVFKKYTSILQLFVYISSRFIQDFHANSKDH